MTGANNTYQDFMFLSLVLMRMSGFIFLNPLIGRRNVPATAKSGFVIALTIIVASYTTWTNPIVPSTVLQYSMILIMEFVIGVVVTFVISLFLFVIIFAGEFLDMQMGLSMSKIYDAQSNMSLSLSASFYNALFMLLFFSMDGHISLIRILLLSNEVVPYGTAVITPAVSSSIIDLFNECVVLALKFSFPIFAVELIGQIAVGILMKTIPQINVFVINVQAKVLLGILLIVVFFTPMSGFLVSLITYMLDTIQKILALL